MCACSLEPENTLHFLLHCQTYDNLSLLDDANLLVLLLYGDKKYSLTINQKILQATIKFLKDSTRFDGPLF